MLVPPSSDTQTNGTPDKIKKPKLKLSESFVSTRSESPAVIVQDEAVPKIEKPDTGSKCRHCGKSVEKVQLGAHYKACPKAKAERLRKKKEKEAKDNEKNGDAKPEDGATAIAKPSTTVKPAEENTEESIVLASPASKPLVTTSSKKSTEPATNKKNNKKRKAEEAAATEPTNSKAPPPKKQKKKDAAAAGLTDPNSTGASTTKTSKTTPAAATGGKPKLPVDVERQCGVPLPNGSLCARSLTCKSHAMGAKRAVPGRSLPYDILLAQYQKKNQAKQQKAAMMASGAAADSDLLVGEDGARGPVDSDEERDAVMSALARAAPRPLIVKPVVGIRARYGVIRMKEMLAGAMAGGRGAGLFATRPVLESGSAMGESGSAAQTPVETSFAGRKVSVGGGGGAAGVGVPRQAQQKAGVQVSGITA